MATLELDAEFSNNATTFNVEGENKFHDSFRALESSLESLSDKAKSQADIFGRLFRGSQSTFALNEQTEPLKINRLDVEIDYDFIIPLKPKKGFTVKARIKSVEKHNPRIFFD